MRCAAYEGLRLAHEETVAGNEEWWLLKLDKAEGELSVIRLPRLDAPMREGDRP
jgi:hypothetical protein